jgi:hypothetical protein
MKDFTPLDFSHLIAFLLPGFVQFYSLIYISPRASQIVNTCLTKDAGAGAWLVLIFFSLAAGVMVGAFRSLVLDWIQIHTGIVKPKLDYSKLSDQSKLAVFNEAIANTYRFAQFYGNKGEA